MNKCKLKHLTCNNVTHDFVITGQISKETDQCLLGKLGYFHQTSFQLFFFYTEHKSVLISCKHHLQTVSLLIVVCMCTGTGYCPEPLCAEDSSF